MVALNDAPLGTAFTVSVDVRHGLTTGISAEERSNTVRALANGNSGANDFVRPGHVFPLVAKEGGVLMRSGHTEACIDLCPLAGLPPVGVLAELMNDDGTVMRGAAVTAFAERHKLKRISIADLIAYRQVRDKLVKRIGEFPVKSEIGTLTGYAYVTPFDAVQHMAFVHGRIGDGKHVLARLHRADIIRDMFGGANPVHAALRRFKAEGRGVLVLSARRRGRRADPRDPAAGRDEFGGGALAAMARSRPRGADFEGPRHFIDPPAGFGETDLCRTRGLWHRNRIDGRIGRLVGRRDCHGHRAASLTQRPKADTRPRSCRAEPKLSTPLPVAWNQIAGCDDSASGAGSRQVPEALPGRRFPASTQPFNPSLTLRRVNSINPLVRNEGSP